MTAGLLPLAVVFAGLSLASFGGGNVAIPEIHRQTVVLHGWVTEREFAEAFALSRAAPGPSTLFVFLLGMRAAGWAGAAVASLAMFVPGATLMQLACIGLKRLGRSRGLARLLAAMRPLTIGMVFSSAWLIGRTAVTGPVTGAVFLASALLLARTRVPALALLAGAALAGWLAG
jgi:chromate transporter